MIARLTEGLTARALVLMAVLLVLALAAPMFAGDYLLTVLILIFYFAYTGQAWNIMMGFAGQLSLGHALYVGIGAYAAASLFTHVGFDHFTWVNASSGLFLPVKQYSGNDLWHLRGQPVMFYYLLLVATVAALIGCRLLLTSRIGYFWLAIREDEEAARAAGIDTFHYKMLAVVISAAMTSFAGVIYAFYYNNLFPEQVFHISRSIEIILAPIVGGIGTLFGPILGAFILTGLAETLTSALNAVGVDIPGVKQIFYGVCLLAVILALPDGVWPWLSQRLGLKGRGP
jgi:branched-chain amino acid transport system permease protein